MRADRSAARAVAPRADGRHDENAPHVSRAAMKRGGVPPRARAAPLSDASNANRGATTAVALMREDRVRRESRAANARASAAERPGRRAARPSPRV